MFMEKNVANKLQIINTTIHFKTETWKYNNCDIYDKIKYNEVNCKLLIRLKYRLNIYWLI